MDLSIYNLMLLNESKKGKIATHSISLKRRDYHETHSLFARWFNDGGFSTTNALAISEEKPSQILSGELSQEQTRTLAQNEARENGMDWIQSNVAAGHESILD